MIAIEVKVRVSAYNPSMGHRSRLERPAYKRPLEKRLELGLGLHVLSYNPISLRERALLGTQKAPRIAGFGSLSLQWWSEGDLNPRHADFQSAALPTELPDHRYASVRTWNDIVPVARVRVKRP